MDVRRPLPGGSAVRRRMAAALPQAVRNHDRAAVAALRSALGVLSNAESMPVPRDGRSARGVAASEAPRHDVSDLEVLAIVTEEAEQREAAALTYDRLGDPRRAARLRAEAEVLRAFLD